MKRKIITLAMLAACSPLFAAAQEAPSVSTEVQSGLAAGPCLKVKKIKTEFTAVPQGEQINVSLRLESSDCRITRISAQGLTLAATAPFRLVSGSTHYGKLNQKDASLKSSGTAQKIDYQVVIEALPDTPVGEQNVDVTLRYQVLDGNGNVEWREQTVAIPLAVVPAGTHMGRTAQARFKSVAVITLEIVAGIALSPVLLAANIVIFLRTGEWWDGC